MIVEKKQTNSSIPQFFFEIEDGKSILTKIFSYFPVVELDRIAKVCTSFRARIIDTRQARLSFFSRLFPMITDEVDKQLYVNDGQDVVDNLHNLFKKGQFKDLDLSMYPTLLEDLSLFLNKSDDNEKDHLLMNLSWSDPFAQSLFKTSMGTGSFEVV